MNKSKNNLTEDEYIVVLETKVSHLDKLLTISEGQKDHLRKQVHELQEKISEIIKNSGKST